MDVIRDAKFADLPAIVDVLHDGFVRSHFADTGLVNIDVKEAKRLLVNSIQRHGSTHMGGTWVQVSETNGSITGFILGTLARVYAIGDKLMATDLFWLAKESVEPSDPAALMRGMVEWAKRCPGCIEVRCGTTAIIRNKPEQAGAILQRIGMEPYGAIYRKEF